MHEQAHKLHMRHEFRRKKKVGGGYYLPPSCRTLPVSPRSPAGNERIPAALNMCNMPRQSSALHTSTQALDVALHCASKAPIHVVRGMRLPTWEALH